MPLYDFECKVCNNKELDIRDSAISDGRTCAICNSLMTRLLPIPNITPDIEPFMDENLGHQPIYIRSRRHQKEMLREKGLVQIG